MRARRAVLLLALAGAGCRRREPPPPSPVPVRAAVAPDTSGEPDAGGPDPLTEDGDAGGAPTADAATARAPSLELDRDAPPPVSCDGAGLITLWREGTMAWAARWSARPGTDWEHFTLSVTATSVGTPISRMGVAWVPWSDRQGSLHVARIEGNELRQGRALGRYDDVWPIDASATRALLALRARSGRPQPLRLAVASEQGISFPQTDPIGAGRVVAMDDGSPRRVVALVREDDRAGGPWFLRGWALEAPRIAEGATVRLQSLGEVPVGPGSFEVLPTITREGAVVLQTVLGAERGVLRLARFGPNGTALTLLGVAPAALGAVDSEGVLTWWDAHHTPHRSRLTEGGLRDDVVTGPALPDARATLAAAEATRAIECGGLRWTVTMESGEDAGRRMVAVAR